MCRPSLAPARWLARFFACAALLVGPRVFPADAPAASPSETAVARGPVPSWVTPLTWTIPTDPPPQGMPAEVILSDSQDRLTLDGSDFYYHLVVRLLNAEGVRQNAEQSVRYEPSYEKVTWHAIRITRAGVVSDRLPATSFKQLQRELGLEAQIYTGTVTAAAVLDDVRVGDILEIEYTHHSANPVLKGHMSAQNYLGAMYPVRRQVVLVRTPASEPEPAWSFFVPPGTQNLPRSIFTHSALRAAFERPRPPGDEPEKDKNGDLVVSTLPTAVGERIYRWSAEKIPAIVFDSNIPPSAAPYYPTIRCDNFSSWSRVVDWAEPLFAEAMGTLPDDMKKMVAQWKHDYPKPGDRLAAAVHWVQDDVRYFAYAMGEHNLRPRPLPEVCSGRLGDCKDKSVLLAALLRELGFKAWPALVNTYWRERLVEFGPGVYAFNHAIVAYEYEGKLRWLDATLKNQHGAPGLWAVPPYRLALILRPNESELQPVHGPESLEPDTVFKDVFTIDKETGNATLDCEVTIEGLQADFFRQNNETRTAEEMSTQWFNFTVRFYPGLQEVDPPVILPVDDPTRIVIRARYRLPQMVHHENGQTTVSVYAYAFRTLFDPPQSRRRRWPYALPTDRFIRHRIEVQLPFELPMDQQPQVIATDGFNCRIEKALNGHHFVAVHDMRITADYVAAARMEQFSDAADEILNALATTLHYDPAKDKPVTASPAVKVALP